MTLHIWGPRIRWEFRCAWDFLTMVIFCSNYSDVFFKLNSFEKITQQQPKFSASKGYAKGRPIVSIWLNKRQYFVPLFYTKKTSVCLSVGGHFLKLMDHIDCCPSPPSDYIYIVYMSILHYVSVPPWHNRYNVSALIIICPSPPLVNLSSLFTLLYFQTLYFI